MMSRKDYEKFAELLGDFKSELSDPFIQAFCNLLKEDNSRFDEERFKNAILICRGLK